MKQFFASVLGIILISSSISAQQPSPTLMKINGKKIGVSEFEYIFNKNNSNNVIDKKSLEEYVDLFVVFKLKVEEAIAQGIDTTQAFRSELEMYRGQLAEQYLKVDGAMDKLLQEAYERKKEEVEVSHILIRIPETGTSADTLQAYNKAMTIYKRTQKEDFEKLARATSEDQSVAQNGGRVGWISTMRTPYSFENVAFNTPVGKVSEPVRTVFGYHIVKVNDRRQSAGEIKVAHIMLMNNRENPEANAPFEARADSIYKAVKAGENFGELAKKISQDPGSASQGGELPWFGGGQMIPEFENAAFALKNPGDISLPLKSQFGWHIIKLIDKKPLAGFNELKATLEGQLEQSEHANEKEMAFANKLKKEYKFTENPAALADFIKLSDQYAITDSMYAVEANKLNGTLCSFADVLLSQSEFAKFLLPAVRAARGVKSDFIKNKYNEFLISQLTAYERNHLTSKYPDFHNLMQEYHDGILLFDVMNKEVWEKASTDKAGLTKYFEANKAQYAWTEPHYKGRVILAKDKATLKAAANILKRADRDSIDNYLNKRLNDSIQYVKVEKGLWKKGENPNVDEKIFKTGKVSPSKDYPYVLVSGKLLKTLPEDYTDVRGAITANYQDYLEKEWISYLKKKYPVEIDEKVLKTVKKN